MKQCPNCKAIMKGEDYEGVLIHLCQGCKGIWLEENNLSIITERHDQSIDSSVLDVVKESKGIPEIPKTKRDESRKLYCTTCNKPLDLVNYGYSSGIFVDRCDNGCGVFLDDEELEKVQAWVEKYEHKLDQMDLYYKALAGQAEGSVNARVGGFNQNVPAFIFGLPGAIARLIKWATEKRSEK